MHCNVTIGAFAAFLLFMEELHGNLNSNGFFREFLKLTGAGMRIVVSGLKEEGKPSTSRLLGGQMYWFQSVPYAVFGLCCYSTSSERRVFSKGINQFLEVILIIERLNNIFFKTKSRLSIKGLSYKAKVKVTFKKYLLKARDKLKIF
ncbi:uncharacterized protein NECHADRAFT_88028 [Fusarium vanettenii 77-13-4]|uniref:Uncharacterized protein n=1 Tax=Fusarium vanettenii (strain ATCC MYA-4622 / CBS 123669 / FGSC 9596 / NRRL 45880 / 77-13-4) TaxID=660122 RepID=C7ZNA0_FUSV7|nr:uncharacterized protein NECHADRAFT_88028 [Fusarium vanettenii 77-13-4]EEU34520.1 hypothetical protein NECHADRAFT_88028 [Fusarium vanettenii 77-13-4]